MGRFSWGDVNGDGVADIVTRTGNYEIFAILGDGATGLFGDEIVLLTSSARLNTWGVPAVGDLDGDGDNDLVFTAMTKMYVAENDGTGVFSSPIKVVENADMVGAVLDFNNDGVMDVVYGGRDPTLTGTFWKGQGGQVRVALGDSSSGEFGAFTVTQGSLVSDMYVNHQTNAGCNSYKEFAFDDLVIDDMNDDGALDFYVAFRKDWCFYASTYQKPRISYMALNTGVPLPTFAGGICLDEHALSSCHYNIFYKQKTFYNVGLT